MSIDTEPSDALKLCLIYAPEDRKLFASLEKHLRLLERRGWVRSWSVQDVQAGGDPAQGLELQLATSDLVVCLLSVNFPEYYETLTLENVMKRHQEGKVCLIPVLLMPVDIEMLDEPFPQLKPLPEDGRAVTLWRNRQAALVDIAKCIKLLVKTFKARLLGGSPVQAEDLVMETPTIPFWHVPYRKSPWFVGREELLAELHTRLHRQENAVPAVQALSGLGGVGKTQVAVEYAYRYGHEYKAVLWVCADTPENLASDALSLAQTLKLPMQDTPEQEYVLAALRRWFEHQTGWLLVMDNVEDWQTVAAFLPAQYQGHVLVTTRPQVTRTYAHVFPIAKLETEEGALLLLRSARMLGPDADYTTLEPHVWQKAQVIARMFSGLPARLTSVALIASSRSALGRSGGNNTGPGIMQLTRTAGLRLPNSTASARVRVGIAPLDGK